MIRPAPEPLAGRAPRRTRGQNRAPWPCLALTDRWSLALVSDGNSADGGRTASGGGSALIVALAAELVEASGNYGLRPEKLSKAEALPGLSAVRERIDRDDLSQAVAAVQLVRKTVDAGPDERGRAICVQHWLRPAMAVNGAVRTVWACSRRNSTRGRRRATLWTAPTSTHTSRRAWRPTWPVCCLRVRDVQVGVGLLVVGAAVVLAVGIVIFLFMRNDGLVFAPVPE
jgi:hypothetical protein